MEFPRDVELQVIKKLDIDTRRSLNVYTKLKIPEAIREELQRVVYGDRIKHNTSESFVEFKPNYYLGQCSMYIYIRNLEHKFEKVL